MMAANVQLPTPRATPDPESCSINLDSLALSLKLDTLLERYLDLLDQHQQLHAELSKKFSSGFFSLVEANFRAPSGRGRYGQDYYDERMKAQKKLAISQQLEVESEGNEVKTHATRKEGENTKEWMEGVNGEERNVFRMVTSASKHDVQEAGREPESGAKSNKKKKSQIKEENHAKDKRVEPIVSSNERPTLSSPSGSDKNDATKRNLQDPLRWFGILVPPALRAAQNSFVSAVEDPIPRLAGVIAEMRRLEKAVDAVKRDLELLEERNGHQVDELRATD